MSEAPTVVPGMNGRPAVPLVVDVDGTLLGGDVAVEGVVRLLAKSPWQCLWLPIWLAGGRARLKTRVADAVRLPADELVLNAAVVDEVNAAKGRGREVWLATGADANAVATLAESVGATGVLASDGHTNLTGKAKAAALIERFGERGFDYAGNEWRDLAVWKHARCAIGVGLSRSLTRRLHRTCETTRLLPGLGGGWRDHFRGWRPHHWVKNLLVFTPLVAAHEIDPAIYAPVAILFLAFCACASATYLLNDLLDLPYDRRHGSKRLRPLAAGRTSAVGALLTSAVLAASGAGLAFGVSTAAGLLALCYLALSGCYALFLKRKAIIDVVTLAMLHTVRAVAGAVAASILLSPWFIAFFMFVFLALAVAKRQHELATRHDAEPSDGRAYRRDDRDALTALSAASGVAAIVVLAIYLQSAEALALYAAPEWLWLICPLLLYWLGRLNLLANRGAIADDPVLFAVKDRATWIAGVGAVAAFVAAL